MSLRSKIEHSDVRSQNRRDYCKDCPLDPNTGQCKEHAVLMGVSRTGVRILLVVSVAIFGTMAALHWRIGNISDSLAVTRQDVNHLTRSLEEVRTDVRRYLWKRSDGD